MPHLEHPVPVMSPGEYQALTLQEVGDDLVVGGVVYSRSEWAPDPEDGVRRLPADFIHTTPASARAPALTVEPMTAGSWDSGDLPF